MPRIRVFLAAILIFPLLSGCAGSIPYTEETMLMDTFVRVDIRDNLSAEAKKRIAARVIARMKELEAKFDYFSAYSELTVINNLGKGYKLRVSPEMLAVLKRARKLHILTKGAFDISLGRNNWRLDESEGVVWFRKDGIKLDLGGIAKGYIVDEGIKILKKLGVTNALINAGGDMYCLGAGPGDRGWKVGIRSPQRNGKVVEILRVRDKAVATSGGYERFAESGGDRFSHIIDPKTEKPVKDIFKSVTVVAEDCMTADALATALYVAEPRRGLGLILRIGGAECFIIDSSGLTYTSEDFLR
jgi:thiamine biosynthesis lipoprotein